MKMVHGYFTQVDQAKSNRWYLTRYLKKVTLFKILIPDILRLVAKQACYQENATFT